MKKKSIHVKRVRDGKKMSKKRKVTFKEDEDRHSMLSVKQSENIGNSPAIRDSNDSLEVDRKLNHRKNKTKKSKTKTEFGCADNDGDESSQSKSSKSARKKKFKKKKKASKKETSTENEVSARVPKESSNKVVKACLYLERWEYDRDNWKFEKLTQLWLLKNMFDETKIPEKYFLILLKYLIDLKGASKNFAMDSCKSIIKKKEKKSRETEDEQLEFAYQRARSILQYLQ